MFDNLSPWFWIAAAWLQLVIAYGGYMIYLARHERQAKAGSEGL